MEKEKSKTYKVTMVNSSQKEWWAKAEEAKVNCFTWAALTSNYRPETIARLGTDGASLFVFMETDETDLRALANGFGFVHNDSCMEFFVSPDHTSTKYLNFEFNPLGAMYLSIGTSRYDRTPLPVKNYRELFKVRTAIHCRGWNLEFKIPLLFLLDYFPSLELKPGYVMRRNFYKCGDETPRPHYGSWSPINLEKPDFHCPDFFGAMILE